MVEGSIPSGRAKFLITFSARLANGLVDAVGYWRGGRHWSRLRPLYLRKNISIWLLVFCLVAAPHYHTMAAAQEMGDGEKPGAVTLASQGDNNTKDQGLVKSTDSRAGDIASNRTPSLAFTTSEECLDIGRVTSTFFSVPRQFSGISMPNSNNNNINLRVAYFSPFTTLSKQKGTVIVVMGRAEFVENYCDIITFFRSNDYGVLIYDLRGQGLSARLVNKKYAHYYEKGDIDDYNNFVNDHTLLMANFSKSMTRPLYLLSYSMGANIALHMLAQQQLSLQDDSKFRSP
ncbi:MAG: alpha/beta hydrolase, partial [Alphaproteobacteria bacterium]|nr:alpha/beta hydrolase [Alphaproteobacteria bacterium]